MMTLDERYKHDKNRWAFLIPAAGSGIRLGQGPKCFLTLGGEMLWQRAVRRAHEVAAEVVLAVPSEGIEEVRRLNPPCRIIEGGATRHKTIECLLAAVSANNVFIHDVARPFGSYRLMLEVASRVELTGAAGCYTKIDTPLVLKQKGAVMEFQSSNNGLGMVNSPLAFTKEILIKSYRMAREMGYDAQSSVELVFRAGAKFLLADGESDNIKITYSSDYRLACMMVEAWDIIENEKRVNASLF